VRFIVPPPPPEQSGNLTNKITSLFTQYSHYFQKNAAEPMVHFALMREQRPFYILTTEKHIREGVTK